MSISDDALHNRAAWDAESDAYQARHRSQLDGKPLAWGLWGLPDSELGVLGDVSDRDVLELGCGAAQWSVFLAQRGARVVGLDNSARQLEHAARFAASEGVEVPLIHASAESVPLPDKSFDVVFCDHGAMSFTNPEACLAEVMRLLRPGGRFVFNMVSPLLCVCWNPETDALDDRLHENSFELGRARDSEDEMVIWQLGYGDWIRLFRRHGLVVEDLVELRPPADAETTYEGVASLEWARRWPAENIWVLSKPA